MAAACAGVEQQCFGFFERLHHKRLGEMLT
jgi:hypothetical protein